MTPFFLSSIDLGWFFLKGIANRVLKHTGNRQRQLKDEVNILALLARSEMNDYNN